MLHFSYQGIITIVYVIIDIILSSWAFRKEKKEMSFYILKTNETIKTMEETTGYFLMFLMFSYKKPHVNVG